MSNKKGVYAGLVVLYSIVFHEESGDRIIITFSNDSILTFKVGLIDELLDSTYGVYNQLGDGDYELLNKFE